MEEFLDVYERNKDMIEDFIQSSIYNLGSLISYEEKEFSKIFSVFPSLELVYVVNKDTKIQSSPNYFRNKVENDAVNEKRDYIIEKLHFKNNYIAFSSPTNKFCIITSKEISKMITFFFRSMIELLMKFY